MKKIIFVSAIASVVFASCGPSAKQDEVKVMKQYFGDSISEDGAIPADKLLTTMGNSDSFPVKLTGKITDVCQKKGCWMEIDLGQGKTMRVSFRDYGFFVPKDAAGKTAVMDGFAMLDTTSVEELRHYAEDAGKSREETEKITEPEVELSFDASGVIIRDE